METIFNYPSDVQGRGRSGLLWQNFPDLESLALGLSGQGVGFFDDFMNLQVSATQFNSGWYNLAVSSGTVKPYGVAAGTNGKGGVAWLYTTGTQYGQASMFANNGYGPFLIDFLAAKYQTTLGAQVISPSSGYPFFAGPAYSGAPPQTATYTGDLVFEARVVLMLDSSGSPVIPTSNPVCWRRPIPARSSSGWPDPSRPAGPRRSSPRAPRPSLRPAIASAST